MLKTCTVFFLCALAPFFLTAQEADEQSLPKNFLSINGTIVLQQLLSFGNNLNESPVPFLQYKRYFGDYGLRTGVAGDYSKTEADNSLQLTSSFIETRLGFERRLLLGKRWIVSTGADALFRQSYDESDSGEGPNTFQSTAEVITWGGGPVVGLQWSITKSIGLYSETALFLRNSDSKSRFTTRLEPPFPNLTDSFEETSRLVSFDMPSSIYLVVKF